jgi:spore coat protein H
MHRLSFILLMVLASAAWGARAERAQTAAEILQMDRLLTIRIRMTAEQWKMMHPERASRLATALAVVQRPTTQQALQSIPDSDFARPPRQELLEGVRRPPGLVGNQYAYVKAMVTVDDQPFSEVGVRFKGQWSYGLAGSTPRKPLKLKFDHFVDGQYFHGIRTLSLSSNAVDPSLLRESLGFAMFRDAGLPASRTCLAMVFLTVDGLYDSELLGLYTAIEEVDKDFLHQHFGTSRGLVIRPERTRNLAYFGPQWDEYSRYNIQSEPTPFTAQRFIDFTRLINRADDETFSRKLGDFVQTEQFLRFVAVNVIMINLDGVLVNGHNFYIHIHPKTGRLSFIPWDLHYSYGHHGTSMEEWVALTIEKPYRADNRLVQRALATPWMRNAYHEFLRELAAGPFSPQRQHERIDRLEQVVEKARALARAEGKQLPPTVQSSPPRLRAELKPFVSARVEHVLEQLAGRVEGDPVGGRPPPPKPAPAPAPAANPAPAPAPAANPAPKPAPAANPAPTPAPAPKPAPTTNPAPTTKPAPTTNPAPVVAVARPVPAPAPAPPPKPRPLPPNPLASQVLNIIDCIRDNRLTRDELADATMHIFMARTGRHRGRVDVQALAETFSYIDGLLNAFPPSFDDEAPAPDPARPRPALTWAQVIIGRAVTSEGAPATLDELLAAANRMFDEADTNSDGALTVQEISTYMDQLVPRQ